MRDAEGGILTKTLQNPSVDCYLSRLLYKINFLVTISVMLDLNKESFAILMLSGASQQGNNVQKMTPSGAGDFDVRSLVVGCVHSTVTQGGQVLYFKSVCDLSGKILGAVFCRKL